MSAIKQGDWATGLLGGGAFLAFVGGVLWSQVVAVGVGTDGWRPQRLEGAREPSGAVALPTQGGILVVDDEPKHATPRSGGLFFYRVRSKKPKVRPVLTYLPVRLRRQKRRWDDWEGVTATERHVVLLTSHSRHKGKRAKLCRFPLSAMKVKATEVRIDAKLECAGGRRQRRKLKKLLSAASRRFGFSLPVGWRRRGPKRGGLDLEGVLYHPKMRQFFLGLRGPLARRNGRNYAIVLSMEWPLDGRPSFRYAGLFGLGGMGIRGLSWGPGSGGWLLAGPMGTQGPFGLLRLHKLPQYGSVIKATKHLKMLPNMRHVSPEGVVAWGCWLLLFHDVGDWRLQTPGYVSIFRLARGDL